MKVGIEQEIVFADSDGGYLDADTADYDLFSAIVDGFPAFPGDDAFFGCKSLETYPKRCYVEGFERHDAAGKVIETLPKGLEIRTLPHPTVETAVAEFRASWATAMDLAGRAGLSPVLTSRHPFKTALALNPDVDPVEARVRTPDELALARNAMFSHGLHVNVSMDHLTEKAMQDLVEKVNHYLPALIPWSFSSPFHAAGLFEGLCARNYLRAESRRMTDLRLRRDVRVLEFRGFDACGDAVLLADVLRLFCGFLLDDSLPGRAPAQDIERLKRASIAGFGDESIRREGTQVLRAARAAWSDADGSFDRLETLLAENDSYAVRMRHIFARTGSIMSAIAGQYDY